MSCRNSFLAVALDDELRGELAGAARALRDSAADLLDLPPGTGFGPLEADKLHMTFLFFGEHLHALPAPEVRALHGGIETAVAAAASAAAASDAEAIQKRLAFQGFELFPPGKMNLVVARFQASPALAELRDAVIDICRAQGKSLPLSYFSLIEGEGAWSPHVTLGKIKASRGDVGRASCVGKALLAFAPQRGAMPVGLTLLGDRPEGKKWCDWTGPLAFGPPPEPEAVDDSKVPPASSSSGA